MKNSSNGPRKSNRIFLLLSVTSIIAVSAFLWLKKRGAVEESNTNLVRMSTMTVQELLSSGTAYLNKKEARKAMPLLKRATVLDPKNADALNNLGLSYIYIKQYPLAIEFCKKAIDVDQTNTAPLSNLKWAMDQYDLAAHQVDSLAVVDVALRDANYYTLLSFYCFQLGAHTKSLELCEKGLQLDPASPRLLHNKAYNLVILENYDSAIAIFNANRQADPNQEDILANIEWAKAMKLAHSAENR